MNYYIKNATLVNEGQTFVASVVVSDGKIAKIVKKGLEEGPALLQAQGPFTQIIDATGKYLIPGIIDEHVHFREPGLTHKADIYTESRAAVAGGVTSFMDMPNTNPPTTTQELLQQKFDLAAEKSLANYSFYLGATNDNLDEIIKTDPKQVCGIKLFMGSSTAFGVNVGFVYQAWLTKMHMLVNDAGDEVFACGIDDLSRRSLSLSKRHRIIRPFDGLRGLALTYNLGNLALRNENTCHKGLTLVDKCRIFDIVVH